MVWKILGQPSMPEMKVKATQEATLDMLQEGIKCMLECII